MIEQQAYKATSLTSIYIQETNCISPTNKPRVTESAKHNIVDAVDEYVNRKRQKCNIVVYGLPESSTTESGSKDARGIQDLIKDMKVNNAQVTKVSRLGKIQPNKPRPLLVTVDNERNKWLLLKSAPMLRKIPKWQSVYVSPDLTMKEREINRALHQELKRRKEAGEKDLIIKRGKIINRQAGDGPNQPAVQPDK